MTDVDSYVDANAGRFVSELKELCSFASIANHGRAALEPCREWLAERLRGHAETVEVLDEGGMPSLVARIAGEGSKTLLLYSHYDVQPVDPLDLWDSPPFQPSERDGRIFARGVADDKDDVMARLHAIETVKHVRGSL